MSFRSLKNAILPNTFPKAIVYFVVLLSVVMVEFRFEQPVKKAASKKIRAVALVAEARKNTVEVVKAPVEATKPAEVPATTTANQLANQSVAKLSFLPTKKLTPALKKHLIEVKPIRVLKTARKANTKKVRAAIAAPTFEPNWTTENDVSEVLETDTPLNELIAVGLGESELADQIMKKQYLAFHLETTDLGEAGLRNDQVEQVERFLVTEGVLVKDAFEDIEASYTALNAYSKTKTEAAPETTVLAPILDIEPTPVLPASAGPILTQSANLAAGAVSAPPNGLNTAPSFESPGPSAGATSPAPSDPEGEASAPQKESEDETIDADEVIAAHNSDSDGDAPALPTRPSLSPVLASVGTLSIQSTINAVAPSVNSQTDEKPAPQKSGPVLEYSSKPKMEITKKPNGPTSQKGDRSAKRNLVNKKEGSDEAQGTQGQGGTLDGHVSWDSFVDRWIEKNKGHVELRLEPSSSKNQGETIFINDYEFPDPEFSLDTRGMTGNYRLVASFYTPAEIGKVAQVLYSKEIEVSQPGEKVRFNVRRKDLELALSHKEEWTVPRLNYAFTVFEGAAGNHREPKAIAGAQIYFPGFPEFGMGTSDKEGNAKFSNLTAKSEYVVWVEAPGYYPARYIVPAFTSHGFYPLFLIEREKVETITKYFTKSEQTPRNGIVFGRIFDPQTRAPKANEEIQLSARKGRALYIDALPNVTLKETTDTGLFAFFNVSPGVRSLLRGSLPTPLLFTASAGTATYFEFGRSGKASLKGRVSDPFQRTPLEAEIRMVGNPDFIAESEENGHFKFPDVDLPQGVITMEIKAEEYPTTWYTIPWSAKEPQKVREFYVIAPEIIETARKSIAKVSTIKDSGTIVGGADPMFFKTEKCLGVGIETIDGRAVPKELGPFSLSPSSKDDPRPGCISPSKPGFAFFNVPAGEYLLRWTGKGGRKLRSHVIRVGVDKTSIVVN